MKKQVLTSMMLALTVTFAGCGGGSDGPSSSPPPSTGTPGTPSSPAPGAAKVAGPLDAVQGPVSSQIIAPLASTFAGTPLQNVTLCVDQIVVGDVVDLLDVLANAVQAGAGSANPQAVLAATAAGVQGQVENIVIDLQSMLTALDGGNNSCLGNVAPNGSNPLAGTPLAPVGATLAPVLAQVYGQLHGSGSTRPSLSLSTIAGIVEQLEFGVNTAFAQIPADVSSAPVVGAALTTVRTAVGNVSNTINAAAANNVAGTQAAIATTLDSLLTGVLLGVVPVTMIETQAGQPGMLSGPINSGIDDVSSEVASNLALALGPVLEQNLDSALEPVLSSLEASVLSAVLGPLFEALDGVGSSNSNPLGPVTGILDDFFEGTTPAGNPLDLVLDLVSGGSGCPLAGTPLAVLCGS